MPAWLVSLDARALPPWPSVALLLLAIFVASSLSAGARQRATVARRCWLGSAAVALGCGVWAAQVLALCDLAAMVNGRLQLPWLIGSALLTLPLYKCGLAALTSAPVGRHRALGVALLSLAVIFTQMLAMMSVDLAATRNWQWSNLAWVALVAAAFHWWTGRRLAEARAGTPPARTFHHVGLSVSAAAGVLACQWLIDAAPRLDGGSATATLAATSTLYTAVSVGASELLLLLALACALQGRLRPLFERPSQGANQHPGLVDELTGLPTRAGFASRLTEVQGRAEAGQQSVVALLMSLDGFRQTNELHGRPVGDGALCETAQRLRTLVAPNMLARVGGDEFLLLVDGSDALERAGALANQLLECMAPPMHMAQREIELNCSIGMAAFPQHGTGPTLLAHAGIAAAAAKAAGGATYSMFDPRLVEGTREQAELLRDLRMALSRSQLELVYQPKVHASSGQITGVEALLRWHHPQRGLISPGVFIPLAESSGLIHALGEWVIDQACAQARVWRDQGLRMRVAVNLSAHQLRKPDLSLNIDAALRRHQINPALLTCEITETVAMEDSEATLRLFTALSSLGVHLSIDDFGTGYSSLAYLRKLPATELKIDRSFVLDLETSEDARKIAEAVVKLAQSLNMQVVAEGVETDAQYRILRDFGCDQLQGFLFAKPMSAKALSLWAMNDSGPRSMDFRESLFRETEAVAL